MAANLISEGKAYVNGLFAGKEPWEVIALPGDILYGLQDAHFNTKALFERLLSFRYTFPRPDGIDSSPIFYRKPTESPTIMHG